jgi:DNA primase
VYWTRLWRVVTNKPLPKRVGKALNHVSDQDIDRARQADIEPYYEGKLRRFGNRLMGLCPFHEERTPSFCIYPEGRGYHCFGCQAHGDAISFLMKTKGFSFPEAVRSLL